MNFKMFWRSSLCILFTFLFSCGVSEQELMQCAPCQGMGQFLNIRLDPPVKESVEIELKDKTKTIMTRKCNFHPQESSKVIDDIQGGMGFYCSGTSISTAPSPSPTPSSHKLPLPVFLKPEDIQRIDINELVFWGIKEKEIQVILRNLAGDVLAQQNFKLSTEIYPGCSPKYPNCTSTEVTLHLSKPAEPTPTPSSTPSP
ncbi:MAG: hypothetical protein IV090_08070 [Candidatus Sericytochromatia bacterium]|nr:hypothetical protein [Candidatus Sericytochromatia bacterium]